jgi:hypothetical protein
MEKRKVLGAGEDSQTSCLAMAAKKNKGIPFAAFEYFARHFMI